MLSAIVARSKNNVIGIHNDLPWNLPDDLKYFSQTTRGHNVVMGRKTAESIAQRLGHGLPNRENILVTRDPDYTLEGFTVVHTIEDAIEAGGLDGFVIGGEQIFAQALPFCDRLYITEVDVIVDGDAHFPAINSDEWELMSSTTHPADDRHAYSFTFTVLDRKKTL